MDFATKEIFKRYASILVGRPISPVFLNILVTSVCDMRCTHCFFTEELDDRPRKKLQMKAEEIDKVISKIISTSKKKTPFSYLMSFLIF